MSKTSAGEPSSWSELIQARERSNKELAWKAEQQEPVKYVTRYEVSRKERAFDPVLQKFSDSQRESSLCKHEREERTRFLNRRKVQQLNKVSHFNVVNHDPVLPGVREAEARKQEAASAAQREEVQRRRSRTGFNIISNLDLADHHYVAPEERPERLKEKPRTQSFVEKRTSHPDFDVISNRYRESHEAKVAADLEAQKRQAAQRFWETRDFDPVTCKFYDGAKEEKFHKRRVEMEKTHGHNFAKRLPPTLRESDGLRFDIVSMQPRNLNQASDKLAAETSSSVGLRASTERAQQESGVIHARLSEKRKENRCTPERHRQVHSYEHGYDIVNTRPFVGRAGIPKPVVKGSSRKSLWDKLEEQRQTVSAD
ncbi:Hypothetical Protein FCC1311_101012 [Hondaea fermentalgiana]|uniref:Uncharacterized protein n=1 Tax=Hondaea fermentalgiana TaxID=2315210 RepID=A0A2R5GVT4_9STRA|nr:Hypothetical Protein FCC1311_101012 [Hondaea fermentalgiana]|eukprot:GBG33878.1 Hypothetical Protein FCC1311_101012 [Hondaea fermentalgiana]